MSLIDKYKFEHRGGYGCSNSDYDLCRTSCCGAYCVHDNELLDLYLDPADLTKKIEFINPAASCPFCGSQKWKLEDVMSLTEVPADWKWAAYER